MRRIGRGVCERLGALLYRKHLSKGQAYAALKKCDFSSEQVGLLLIAVEMRHAGLVELKKYEQGQLELAIAKRERAVRDKQKKIATLEKQQDKLRAKRDKLAPKPGKPRSKKYREALAKLREIPSELALCRNWVEQKERVLEAKRGLLQRLVADVEAGRYSLCFGSKKLLAQRPTAHNENTTPFTSLDDWPRHGTSCAAASGGPLVRPTNRKATLKSSGCLRLSSCVCA